MRIFLFTMFASAGALIGWLDPSMPDHMIPAMNIGAGIVAGIVTFVLFAVFLKEANEREQISRLMHECYLGSSQYQRTQEPKT